MTTTFQAGEHRISAPENDRMRQAAEILLQARREVTPIDDLPEKLRPRTLDEAYALQDLMALAMSPIGGWKVGAAGPEGAPMFSAMPAWGGYAGNGGHISAHFRRLREVEAEVAFLLDKDLPRREQAYSREEVSAAIGSAHPAIEFLESAFSEPAKADRLSVVGDLLMNGGFAYGAAVTDWQTHDLAKESVTVTVDGSIRFAGTTSNPAGTDLLGLVTWLANEGAERTGGLKAGQVVTTGSWSGKTGANAGSNVEVAFSTFGAVSVHFE
jgi:2-keto-4-pentenoate hydratase